MLRRLTKYTSNPPSPAMGKNPKTFVIRCAAPNCLTDSKAVASQIFTLDGLKAKAKSFRSPTSETG
jgi:hypothetical protein